MKRTPMPKPKALYILEPRSMELIYGSEVEAELKALADFYAPPQTSASVRAHLSMLEDVEVIFTGWGGPRLDMEFLEAAKNLKVVFYGAGSIRGIVTPEFWERDIRITHAAYANAIPVAEYCLGAILLSMKHLWPLSRQTRENMGWIRESQFRQTPGNYNSRVGIISLGAISRRLLKLLEPFEIECLLYSQPKPEADVLGLMVEYANLEKIFKTCDVISLHAPCLPETRGMITGRYFQMMKPGATFINTARGGLVKEAEMCEVLKKRPEINVILDVTDPEPPDRDSPLTWLPNVLLTPHIAGSAGPECRRLGLYMLEEFIRYLDGKPLASEISRESFATTA